MKCLNFTSRTTIKLIVLKRIIKLSELVSNPFVFVYTIKFTSLILDNKLMFPWGSGPLCLLLVGGLSDDTARSGAPRDHTARCDTKQILPCSETEAVCWSLTPRMVSIWMKYFHVWQKTYVENRQMQFWTLKFFFIEY